MTVPQIEMSSGCCSSCYAISRQSHIFVQFKNNCTHNSQIALTFALCNYLTVIGTIILKLHSIVCEISYILGAKQFSNPQALNCTRDATSSGNPATSI